MIYGKSKSMDKDNAATSLPAQSANMAKTNNCCFHPLCRGRNKLATHTWENSHRNRHSAHCKQQANNGNRGSEYQTKSSRGTKSGQYHKRGNTKFKQNTNQNNHSIVQDDTKGIMEGLRRNKNGAFASPAVWHTLTKVHQMSNESRKRLVLKLQRALAVENIVAYFVSSGNQKNLVQEFRKLTSATNTTGDSPSASKRAKKQSSNQADNSADRAMVATTVNTYRTTKQKQNDSNQPQKCKQCGKFVIHTNGICDVYIVPAVHMASSRIRYTQKMSVIFNSTNFEDHEYMFTNDLGIINDLTLDNYLKLAPPQVRTSAQYELSDSESPQIPTPPS
jgi:hypothetical protein